MAHKKLHQLGFGQVHIFDCVGGEEAILNVKKAIAEGRTIVEPLKASGVFPAMVVSMIGVGEQAGALEVMLTKIATFYEEEVDAAVGDLMTALEPMIIVVLGTTVGGIVISMYMPILSDFAGFSTAKIIGMVLF